MSFNCIGKQKNLRKQNKPVFNFKSQDNNKFCRIALAFVDG